MILPPPLGAILAQELLVNLADLLQNLTHTIQVLQLLTDLGDLRGMDADLAVPGARVVDVEDPLKVPCPAGAGGAGNRGGMKGVPFEEGPTKDLVERRKAGEKLAGFGGGRGLLPASHLYRCYKKRAALSIHLWKKMFGRTGKAPSEN
jgi:hypothetical protein